MGDLSEWEAQPASPCDVGEPANDLPGMFDLFQLKRFQSAGNSQPPLLLIYGKRGVIERGFTREHVCKLIL
jgi:hypothetical protein